MTELDKLQELRVPSDLTKEQIFELFRLTQSLCYAQIATNTRRKSVEKRMNDLTGWFMSQNFQNQISPQSS